MTRGRRTRRWRRATLWGTGAALTALGLAARAGTAQMSSPADERWADSGWTDEVAFAAANAAISGVVIGLFRALSDDGSFGEGFWSGAAAGAVAYGGKRISAERFDGAGFLGRQIASVGGSLAANARDGRGPLDRVTFQLGLGRLYWDRSQSQVTFRPDVITLYYTAAAVANSRVSVDWSRSLSAGAPIFVTEVGATSLSDNAAGRAYGGVVVIDLNAQLSPDYVAAHEQVHVLQYDQQYALWGEAADRAVVSQFGTGVERVLGRVDLGVGLLPVVPFLGVIPRDANPFEIEADFLTARGGR